jgi:hypothetical protein
MINKITTALNNRIFSNNMIMENLQATKNEVLRRIGVGVCSTFLDKIYGLMPQSLKLRIFLMSSTGKAISTVLLSQAIGQVMYNFKDKLSEENQKYLELIRLSAWSASATAMMDLANLDKLFDMLVPDSMKQLLSNGMKDLKQLDNKIAEAEANK